MPRKLKNWLRAYIHHARHSEAPERFHFWCGVSAVAGALQRKVWIDERYFEWVPNFYIVLLAPAGIATKSTSVDLAMDILKQVKSVQFGPPSITWQALVDTLGEAQRTVPVNGANFPMASLTCKVRELGTFLATDDNKMVSVLTDLWDGYRGTWQHRTRGIEGQKIINPWINIIAATTPSWLKENVGDSMIGGGLMSRIVMLSATHKRHLTPHPSRIIDETAFAAEQATLVHDLTEISKLAGPMTITEDAYAFSEEYYAKIWSERPEHVSDERFEGYWARKQTHTFKLSMVLSAARGDSMTIERSDLEQAARIITNLEMSMPWAYRPIGESRTARNVSILLSCLRVTQAIGKQELYRRCYTRMDSGDFLDALQAGIHAGWFAEAQNGADITIRLVNDPNPQHQQQENESHE